MTRISLSKREKEIVILICQELSYKQIAQILNISKRTVETHKINIARKLGVKKVTGIVIYAFQQGWINEINEQSYFNQKIS